MPRRQSGPRGRFAVPRTLNPLGSFLVGAGSILDLFPAPVRSPRGYRPLNDQEALLSDRRAIEGDLGRAFDTVLGPRSRSRGTRPPRR